MSVCSDRRALVELYRAPKNKIFDIANLQAKTWMLTHRR